MLISLCSVPAKPTIKAAAPFVAGAVGVITGLGITGASIATGIYTKQNIKVLKKAGILHAQNLQHATIDLTRLSTKEQAILQKIMQKKISPRTLKTLNTLSTIGTITGIIITGISTGFMVYCGIKPSYKLVLAAHGKNSGEEDVILVVEITKNKPTVLHSLIIDKQNKKEGIVNCFSKNESTTNYNFEDKTIFNYYNQYGLTYITEKNCFTYKGKNAFNKSKNALFIKINHQGSSVPCWLTDSL